MALLHVIGLGGCGARAAETVAHCAAAGLVPADRLRVLFVDSDTTDGNVTRARGATDALHRLAGGGLSLPVFQTAVDLSTTLTPCAPGDSPSLDEYLRSGPQAAAGPGVAHLLGALYTPEELRSTLDAGFVGRPAIGARLRAEIPHGDIGDIEGCDQVTESIEAAGAEEVTIVLVGSAFGGTGASGLPAIGHALRGRIRRRLGHPAASLKLVGVLCLPHFRSGESLEPTDRMAEHPALRAEHEGHLWRAQNALRYLETHSNAQDAPAIFDALYIHGSPQPQQYRGRLGAPEHNDLPHWIELLTVATIRDVRATRPDPVAPAPAIWRRTHARQAWGDVTDGPQLRERLGAFAQFSRFVATQVAPCLPDIPGHASRREPRFYRNSIAPNYREEAQGYHDLVRYCDSFTQWFSEIHDNPTPDGSARLMEYGQDDLPKAGDASDPSRRRSRGCRRDQQASRVATELSRASAGCVGIHRFSEACLNACRALVG